jgi:hypothetical protein
VVTRERFAAAIVWILLSAVAAQAEPILHRSAVAAGEAVPTGGSFSITFPIAFSDVEIRAEDPPSPTLVTHLLMGLNPDGLRVSAMEMSGPKISKPIDGLMETAKTRPGTTVSEIVRSQTGDIETLSFMLTEPKGGSFFRQVRTKDTEYVLVIQFPEAIRGKAALLKDDYFGSFRITLPRPPP